MVVSLLLFVFADRLYVAHAPGIVFGGHPKGIRNSLVNVLFLKGFN